MKKVICFILRLIASLSVLLVCMIDDFTSFSGYLCVVGVCALVAFAGFKGAAAIEKSNALRSTLL